MKKLLISLILSLYLFSLSLSYAVPSAKAVDADPWFYQNFPQWYVKVYDPGTPSTEIFGERYTAAQVSWVFYSIPGYFITQIFGPEFPTCVLSGEMGACIVEVIEIITGRLNEMLRFFDLPEISQAEDGKYYAEKEDGFSLYAFFYNNPSSGLGYFLRKLSGFGIIPEATAQGFGFREGANTVLTLWRVTRDISYGFLVLAIIISAFMIMFRVKISPQVVITIQSALPKLVVAIILITFSYAIAGLLIDLMYVAIGIIAMVLDVYDLSTMNAVGLFRDLTNDRNAFVLTWQFAAVWFFASISTIVSASWFGGFLMLIFTVVILILCLLHSVKIIWLLIKTYLNIILLIVAAPFHILLGVVSSSAGLGPWLKSMLANLAVYPTVGLLFVLAFFFLSQTLGNIGGWDVGKALVPFDLKSSMLPITASWDPPLTWGTKSAKFLYMMAAFGIFALIPKVADIIKSMIEGKPFAYGTAIGEATGAAAAIPGTAAISGVGKWLTTGKGKIPDWVRKAGWRERAINALSEAGAKKAAGGFK